jgi:hypothetical protein
MWVARFTQFDEQVAPMTWLYPGWHWLHAPVIPE